MPEESVGRTGGDGSTHWHLKAHAHSYGISAMHLPTLTPYAHVLSLSASYDDSLLPAIFLLYQISLSGCNLGGGGRGGGHTLSV